MGLAQVKGLGQEAARHLRKVRGFSKMECDEHIASAFDTWNYRNNFEWNLDLTMVTDSGITLKTNVSREDRSSVMQSFFDGDYY